MRRAADYLCVFVGRRADHLHHPSGRDADGKYLDRDLVIPLARVQHDLEHVALDQTTLRLTDRPFPNMSCDSVGPGTSSFAWSTTKGTESILLPSSFVSELALHAPPHRPGPGGVS